MSIVGIQDRGTEPILIRESEKLLFVEADFNGAPRPLDLSKACH